MQSNQVIIGMFDRDTPLLTEINGSRVDIRNEKFVKIGKNIFAFSIAKLGRNETIRTDILEKICIALDCNVEDIMEITHNDGEVQNGKK